MATPQTKQCSACKQLKPTTDFYKHKTGKNGLHPECKSCLRVRDRKWREANREKYNAAKSRWECKHPEHRRKCTKRWRAKYPQKHAARNLKWYHDNRELVLSRFKKYRDNLDPIEKKSRRATEYERNADRYRKNATAWRIANPEKRRVNHLRREARKRNLPHDWTLAQMNAAIAYWGGKCPVCKSDTTEKRQFDHWIPLICPECPGTVAHNLLPLCEKCNLRKNDSMPVPWLKFRFPDTWQQILARIESYFTEHKCPTA